LHDDVAVGEADDEAVLGRIVLVLGLGDETLAGIVIGLSCTTALVLSLISTVIRAVLDQLGERLVKGAASQQLAFQNEPNILLSTLMQISLRKAKVEALQSREQSRQQSREQRPSQTS